MGWNFYQRQLDKYGTCAGHYGKPKRRKNMAWDDASKAQAVEMYEAEEPTPENSMEIVKSIAEEMGQSPNGVRMILTKAGVYVKKAPAAGGSAKSSGTSTGGTRISKAAAQEALTAALTDAGIEIDEDIVTKLTGKAAQYFADALNKVAA
jgi:transposase-like protein